uniref:Three-finger toxin 18 n=1 Tax=Micrurus tener TaxID=1114301 RepID=A0A194ASE3_9SAUR
MKALLLTLVVVTIMCLDIGYTLECYVGRDDFKSVTCPEGENHCYAMAFWVKPRPVTIRGCASSCSSKYYMCCPKDKCNENYYYYY